MYALFCFGEYYPSGGANDFAGLFDSYYEALAHVLKNHKALKREYAITYDLIFNVMKCETGEVYPTSRVFSNREGKFGVEFTADPSIVEVRSTAEIEITKEIIDLVHSLGMEYRN